MQAVVNFSTWKECFEPLPDPRVVGRTRHRLIDVLFLTLCGVTVGMDDYESIEDWGNERLDWLQKFVGLEHGIPSHDTLARVFAALDSKQFEACFVRWMSTLCPPLAGEIVAMDGKTVRGAHGRRGAKAAIHMVSAFVCGHGITLGQWKTEHSNEITVLPELIAALDLRGATVTLDAMGCQKEVAQALVAKDAEYVMALKGNQGTLHQQVATCFDMAEWRHYQDFANWGHTTEDCGHGRQEQRRCIALACPPGEPFDAWAGIQTMVMVESMRQTEDAVASEKRYYVSSLPPDSEDLARVIRSHWEIENRLHWCLDVTFHEDACRTRTDHAPENLNIVRKIVMNLLRLSSVQRSLRKKRLRACLNSQYLEEVLGASQ